ncbi:MAG: dihydroorotase [Candidatus Diapherotrites archaeon]|uniref:Dihydroorotase n=1 Tax=Candidatus Iainarchaeum sp. TaxID=3101447 RepID=A0A938YU83_9ARCH|nr:dihydroorotase [Candidatus Diapherotrites archaeon]
MDFVLENALVFIGSKLIPKSVLVKEGKIAALEQSVHAAKRIDCKGNILLPGLIDAHVHFRIPGGAQKEDWSTGSAAALAGGVTTVIDMPNNNPSCTTRKALADKEKVAKADSKCNFAFHFGASNDNMRELEQVDGIASFKVFLGASTGNLLITDPAILRKVFSIAKERNIAVVVHAEDEDIIKENTAMAKEKGWNHAKYHSKIRTCEAETKSIEKALALQDEIGNKLHILHISSAQGLELVKEAKQNREGITCEATPHHLFLTEESTENLGNFAKMNPSLKSREDVNALWKGLRQGAIDLIATDHAPHTIQEKEKPYWEAPSGVPGIETMLPLLLDAVNKEKIELKTIVEKCCIAPARVYGFESRGEIKVGKDADLTLIDLQKKKTIKNGQLQTKCNWSPFATWELQGSVERVFVRGRLD